MDTLHLLLNTYKLAFPLSLYLRLFFLTYVYYKTKVRPPSNLSWNCTRGTIIYTLWPSRAYQVVVEHLSICRPPCYPSPIPRLRVHPVSLPPFVRPQHNYSQHDKWQAPSAEISKKGAAPATSKWRHFGSAVLPVLIGGRAVPLAVLRPSSAFPPSLCSSMPSSGGLVREPHGGVGPAWFISLAPLPGHSHRPKEPTRLQRAPARKPRH